MIEDKFLLENYHVLHDLQRAWYRAVIAPSWTERQRFFFEGELGLIGQMNIADREALFETILTVRPRRVFEVGTWTGGGSTFFMASAFAQLGVGEVITLEPHPILNTISQQYYSRHLPRLVPHVRFLTGSDVESAFTPYLADGLECVFLDGAENAEETWAQFQFFSRFLRPGTVLMAHDWETEKMRLVRPALEGDGAWELVKHIGQPDSLGFVIFRRRGLAKPVAESGKEAAADLDGALDEYNRGAVAAALARCATALAANPSQPSWLLLQGASLLAQKRPAEALASLQQALKLAPSSELVYRHLADALEALGRGTEAHAARQQSLILGPTSGRQPPRWVPDDTPGHTSRRVLDTGLSAADRAAQ